MRDRKDRDNTAENHINNREEKQKLSVQKKKTKNIRHEKGETETWAQVIPQW